MSASAPAAGPGAGRGGAGAASFDVAVVGGGPAGIAAAVAAASCGARVLLVEKDAALGGNVSQALVHTICGLYLPADGGDALHAHLGLPRAFAERLVADGDAGRVEWAGRAAFLPIDPEAFATLGGAACHDAGVRVATGAPLASLSLPESDGDPCVATLGDGAVRAFEAWAVVDATGDAVAAALAGAPTEAAAPRELQHASFIFRVDGVDTGALDRMEGARTTAAVARAAASGALPASACAALVRPSVRPGSVFVTLNRPKPDPASWDPLDARAAAALDADARRDAGLLLGFLVASRAPFRRAVAGAWPARTGIRETRRIAGLVRLEARDVLEGRRTDDEACLTTWPVETWDSHKRMSFRAVAGAASIPLGCLVSKHPSHRLAMAGRCASASHEALGAIRVVGTAMAMGEAAGVAAAIAARDRRDLSTVAAAAVRDAVASGATTKALA